MERAMNNRLISRSKPSMMMLCKPLSKKLPSRFVKAAPTTPRWN
jgi:hypothetical protein